MERCYYGWRPYHKRTYSNPSDCRCWLYSYSCNVYYPNRQQAMRIQQTLKTLYQGIGGFYYYGDGAWKYVFERTGIDLKAILEQIANERVPQNGQL